MPRAVVVGGGWAGCAAALTLARGGWNVTLYEAARTPGGRARGLEIQDGQEILRLDNGQHILIGAYAQSLALMQSVGVDSAQALLRVPMALTWPDGSGLRFPRLPPPWNALLAIATARGWPWRARAALLARAGKWAFARFGSTGQHTVADLCRGLPPQVVQEFVEPLCISALNTALHEASARAFLRVLQDALLAQRGGADFLLPRCDLGALFPIPALAWLQARGQPVHLGRRVRALLPTGPGWRVLSAAGEEAFDAALLACPSWEATRLVQDAAAHPAAPPPAVDGWQRWAALAAALPQRPIATVYARSTHERLPASRPWLALRSASGWPAQFVFDRSALGGPDGLMAFVLSHCTGARDALQAQVLAQARAQLGWSDLQPLATVVEKRATFACLPGLQRPGMHPGAALWACGDYVDGPYPATIEGAVRSGVQAARALMAGA